MSQLAIDFEAARQARDEGMTRALDRAERNQPTWGGLAFQYICNYARTTPQFVSEDVTEAAKAWGLIQPEDGRAWGQPFRRAAKEGVIEKIGFGIAKNRHLSPTPL